MRNLLLLLRLGFLAGLTAILAISGYVTGNESGHTEFSYMEIGLFLLVAPIGLLLLCCISSQYGIRFRILGAYALAGSLQAVGGLVLLLWLRNGALVPYDMWVDAGMGAKPNDSDYGTSLIAMISIILSTAVVVLITTPNAQQGAQPDASGAG